MISEKGLHHIVDFGKRKIQCRMTNDCNANRNTEGDKNCPNEALNVGVQIAGASARAHSSGIIHRDLKPANMMADELLGQPTMRAEELKRKLMHLTVNPALAMACVLENNATTKLAVRGSAYDSSSQNPVLCNSKSLIGTRGSYVVARATLTNEELPTPIGELVLIAAGPSLGKLVLRWLVISLVLSGLLGGICWIVGLRFERKIATSSLRVTTRAPAATARG